MAETEKTDQIDDKPMPLMEHLLELRFIIAFLGCYHFSAQIYLFLAQPLADVFRENGEARKMIYTSLTEAFFTYMKVAAFGAAFFSFPVVSGQLWMFIAPGLYRSEKKAILPFLAATPVLFVLGASVVYYFVIPVAWRFFISFEIPASGNGLPIELQPKVGEYLDLVMKLILAFGVAFQLPVALSLMAKVGIVTSAGLKKFRRYAVVLMTVIAAVLAPPDPGSMVMLAVPLMALYEISIIAARFVEPKPSED
ncbi:MAG: twin-arginine translocase subunit TatC [Alphaproteobacteria bacterium]|nr:twin-arginine translocase subunit TatC [Alphaproteobacteria bacterium]